MCASTVRTHTHTDIDTKYTQKSLFAFKMACCPSTWELIVLVPRIKRNIFSNVLGSRKYSVTAKFIKPTLLYWQRTDRPTTSCCYQRGVSTSVIKKKLQYLSNHNRYGASKFIRIKYQNIYISTIWKEKMFFFLLWGKGALNIKISFALTTPVLCWLQHWILPKIAQRSGAFLACRGPSAVSRQGCSGWHRRAVVDWTWGHSGERRISLPKGSRVRLSQYPVAHHYQKCLHGYSCNFSSAEWVSLMQLAVLYRSFFHIYNHCLTLKVPTHFKSIFQTFQ